MQSKMVGDLQKTAVFAKIMLDFKLSEFCEFLSKKSDQVIKNHLFCQEISLARALKVETFKGDTF